MGEVGPRVQLARSLLYAPLKEAYDFLLLALKTACDAVGPAQVVQLHGVALPRTPSSPNFNAVVRLGVK